MKYDAKTFKLSDPGKFATIALALGAIGIAASVYGWTSNADQFFRSWLVAFGFWVTISLGALFYTLIHHVTGAKKSANMRRFSEVLGSGFPVLLVLFLPVLFGMHSLYHWSHEDAVAADHILQWKQPYLNTTSFTVRSLTYFAVWIVISLLLCQFSIRHDIDGDKKWMDRLAKVSAIGTLLFAITITFSAFDWYMSLSPHWYSTIYGVYVFAGSFLSFIAFMTVFMQGMVSKGALGNFIGVEQFHDMGRWLFGFIVFWAYIGASQYFLIWYGNLPEETVWYLTRWENGWKAVSQSLMYIHFSIPFVVLAFYNAKRNAIIRTSMAGLILVMHYVDIYWLIMPSFGHGEHAAHFHPSWMDLSTLIGVSGIVLGVFFLRWNRRALAPIKDSNLTVI